jgi:transcriptional regulator with XRE-family HTH domain
MSAAAAHPLPADESFGRRLRRERERRQIAIASIAENSKIKASLFEELERDDVSHWPSGVFRRAFIRAYADAIGLNADAIAREFLERFPDPNDPDRHIGVTAPPGGAPPAAPVAAAAPPSPAPSIPKPLAVAAVKVTIAETPSAFSGGRLLSSARSRFAAIGCDLAIVITLGLTMYLMLGTVWMPLCLALAGYYAGAILLLGNTPGVCLCASSGQWRDNDSDA